MRRWLRALNILALAASVSLIGVFLWRNRTVLSQVTWGELVRPMTLGVLLYGVSLGAQALVWIATVSEVTGTSWGVWDFTAYLETHLMRRLPGAPWYIAGRVAKYETREAGRGAQAALAVSLLEWSGSLATAGIWIVIGYYGWLPGLVMAAIVVAAVMVFMHLAKNTAAPRWLRKMTSVSVRQVLRALGVYMIIWPIAAAMLRLFLTEIAPHSGLSWGTLSGAWAASAALSMLMVFAPGGLGVRELTLAVQLDRTVGLAKGALVALLMRLVFVLGDVFYLALTMLLLHFHQRRSSMVD